MKIQRMVLILAVAGLFFAQSVLADGWQSLFNGQNLEGWKVLGSPEWKVENNVISVQGKGDQMGWLMAEKPYSDFVFRARFKWSGGNSGIQIRSKLEDNKMIGYQCNLDPSRDTATGSLLEENGRGVLRESTVTAEKNFKKDAWNEYEVSAIGDHIIIWVNGVKTAEMRDKQGAKDGILALQMDNQGNGVMQWSDLRILEIPNKQDWTSLFNGQNLSGWHPLGDSTWAVEDGAIHGKFQNLKYGWLVSDKEYKDFYLQLRFKVPSGNSGIQFRSLEVQDDQMVHGLQADIDSDSDWINGHLYDQNGDGSLVKPTFDVSKIIDWNGWNTYEITAIGPKVELFINGVKTIEYENAKYDKAGIFAFQIHMGKKMETFWKDMQLIQF